MSGTIEAKRVYGAGKVSSFGGNMLTTEPIIIAVPNDIAIPFDVSPFNELYQKFP